MGDLEGVGRIYRPELNTQVGRSPKIEPTEPDHQRQQKDEQHREGEPKDTVELHESESLEPKPLTPNPKHLDPESHLDVSA